MARQTDVQNAVNDYIKDYFADMIDKFQDREIERERLRMDHELKMQELQIQLE